MPQCAVRYHDGKAGGKRPECYSWPLLCFMEYSISMTSSARNGANIIQSWILRDLSDPGAPGCGDTGSWYSHIERRMRIVPAHQVSLQSLERFLGPWASVLFFCVPRLLDIHRKNPRAMSPDQSHISPSLQFWRLVTCISNRV